MPFNFVPAAAGALGIGVTLAITAPAAGAAPDDPCPLATPVQQVRSVSQLPPRLGALLPPMAEPGRPFNTGDVVDPALPDRALIRAGHRGDDWFVWYERGGSAPVWQAVVAHVPPDDSELVPLANARVTWEDAAILCVVTDGVFAGTVPPYPAGAAEATAY